MRGTRNENGKSIERQKEKCGGKNIGDINQIDKRSRRQADKTNIDGCSTLIPQFQLNNLMRAGILEEQVEDGSSISSFGRRIISTSKADLIRAINNTWKSTKTSSISNTCRRISSRQRADLIHARSVWKSTCPKLFLNLKHWSTDRLTSKADLIHARQCWKSTFGRSTFRSVLKDPEHNSMRQVKCIWSDLSSQNRQYKSSSGLMHIRKLTPNSVSTMASRWKFMESIPMHAFDWELQQGMRN